MQFDIIKKNQNNITTDQDYAACCIETIIILVKIML